MTRKFSFDLEADEYADAPTGWYLIEAIRHRGWWTECSNHNCRCRIDDEMVCYDVDEFGEDIEEQYIDLEPCCTTDGEVFCCRECRGQYMRDKIAVLTRRQEQIRIVRQTFGEVTIDYASGNSRSGFCRCRDRNANAPEYPGS